MVRKPKGNSPVRSSKIPSHLEAQISALVSQVRERPKAGSLDGTALNRARKDDNDPIAAALLESKAGPQGPEQRAHYDKMLKGFRESYQPATPAEDQMVVELVNLYWQLSCLSATWIRICSTPTSPDFADAIVRAAPITAEEERVGRRLSRLRREIISQQRRRLELPAIPANSERRAAAEAAAAHGRFKLLTKPKNHLTDLRVDADLRKQTQQHERLLKDAKNTTGRLN